MANPVNFTRPAAERIAKVVRAIEYGSRDGSGPTLDRPWYGEGRPFKLSLATFTGSWETGTYKTVTLHGSTATASVYNWCNPALLDAKDTGSTSVSRFVIFGRVQGTNSAVELQMRSTATQCTATMVLGTVDLSKLPGYAAGEIQMLGHAAGGTANGDCPPSLTWYSITTCSTAA